MGPYLKTIHLLTARHAISVKLPNHTGPTLQTGRRCAENHRSLGAAPMLLLTALDGKCLFTRSSSWTLFLSLRDTQWDHRTERSGAVLGRRRPLLPSSHSEPCPGSQRLGPAPRCLELSAKCRGGEGKREGRGGTRPQSHLD